MIRRSERELRQQAGTRPAGAVKDDSAAERLHAVLQAGQAADLEIEDLNPKRFAQKHVFDDPNADQGARRQPTRQAAADSTPATPGEGLRG